jgi:hypothetical protein
VALPEGQEGVELLRMAGSPGSGKGVTGNGGVEAGMENPTTDEVGSKGL